MKKKAQDIFVYIFATSWMSIIILTLFYEPFQKIVYYPLLVFFIALAPIFFMVFYTEHLTILIVRLHRRWNKNKKCSYTLKSQYNRRKFPIVRFSLLTSIYPLGIIWKFPDWLGFGDEFKPLSEFDSSVLAIFYVWFLVLISLSLSLYFLEKSNLKIHYDNGDEFNIGRNLRGKLHGFLLATPLLFLVPYFGVTINDLHIMIYTLLISWLVTFSSSLCSCLFIEKTKSFEYFRENVVLKLEKIIRIN